VDADHRARDCPNPSGKKAKTKPVTGGGGIFGGGGGSLTAKGGAAKGAKDTAKDAPKHAAKDSGDFSEFCELCQSVEKVGSHLAKTKLIHDYLASFTGEVLFKLISPPLSYPPPSSLIPPPISLYPPPPSPYPLVSYPPLYFFGRCSCCSNSCSLTRTSTRALIR
jgi:hypothetical protein